MPEIIGIYLKTLHLSWPMKITLVFFAAGQK